MGFASLYRILRSRRGLKTHELRRHPAGSRVPRRGQGMDLGQRAEAVRGRASQILARPHRAQGRQHPRGRKGLAEEEGRRRLGLPALAEGIWRPRIIADRARDLAAGRGPVRQALRHVHHRPRHVRADHDGVRRRGAEAQVPAAAGLGRKGLVPVVLRTRRRFRRRGPAHPRREEGRRLDHQRPEDLDLGRALL